MRKFSVLMIFCLWWSATGQTFQHNRPADKDPTLREIRKLGRMQAKIVLSHTKVVHDKKIREYLNGIIQQLLAYSPPQFKDTPYSVSIVNYPALGMMSFTNGEIIVDLAFLCDVRYEDVLALMLSHEINHVGLRHALEETRLQRRQRKTLTTLIGHDLEYMVKVAASFKEEFNNKVYLDEAVADLRAAQVIVSAGYLIENPQELQSSFKVTEIHPEPKLRTRAIMGEMQSWQQLCPTCKPRVHPRPSWLGSRCASYGLIRP